jgi:hypothetical protein
MRRQLWAAIFACWVPAVAALASADAPDPPPLVESKQWVFDLRWDRGEVFLVGVHPLDLGSPQATPRAMGRFAIELYDGATLLERVRFDFPLLGPTIPDGGRDPIAAKLRTRIGVIFPATKRGSKLELLDRTTGQRWALPWPPPSIADGGSE